jgi:hypothetical protein
MNWDWATEQMHKGFHVVRESERRNEKMDELTGDVRWMGREGVKALAGFDLRCQPVFMLVGTHSQVPIECSADDVAATDWELE